MSDSIIFTSPDKGGASKDKSDGYCAFAPPDVVDVDCEEITADDSAVPNKNGGIGRRAVLSLFAIGAASLVGWGAFKAIEGFLGKSEEQKKADATKIRGYALNNAPGIVYDELSKVDIKGALGAKFKSARLPLMTEQTSALLLYNDINDTDKVKVLRESLLKQAAEKSGVGPDKVENPCLVQVNFLLNPENRGEAYEEFGLNYFMICDIKGSRKIMKWDRRYNSAKKETYEVLGAPYPDKQSFVSDYAKEMEKQIKFAAEKANAEKADPKKPAPANKAKAPSKTNG